jgi:hypothetical protein
MLMGARIWVGGNTHRALSRWETCRARTSFEVEGREAESGRRRPRRLPPGGPDFGWFSGSCGSYAKNFTSSELTCSA